MAFLHVLYLLGALSIAGPILYHLLLRDRPKRQALPTLRFLPRSAPQSYSMHRLKNYLLMVLRCLVLLLIVLALARPYLKRERPKEEGKKADLGNVYVLDRSMSMQVGGNWDQAVSRIESLVKIAPVSSPLSLIVFDRSPKVVTHNTTDPTEIIAALKTLKPGFGSTDLISALRTAGDAAGKLSAIQKKIYLVSDFQSNGMKQIAVDIDLPPETEIIPVSIEVGDPDNVAILSVRDEEIDVVNKRRVSVLAQNFGGQKFSGPLALTDHAGSVLGTKPMELNPGERRMVEFIVDLDTGKDQIVLVRLDGRDSMPFDNERTCLLESRAALPLAILGKPGQTHKSASAPPMANAYLKAAIGACGSKVKATWMDCGQVKTLSADTTPAVVSDCCGKFGASDMKSLLAYVESGGVLIAFADEGNDANFKLLTGVDLAEWQRLPPNDFRLVSGSKSRGAFSLEGEHEALLGHPRAMQFLKCSEDPAKALLSRIQLDDGSPFLLDRALGAGRIFLFTTPLNQRSTDFVIRSSFSPFLYGLMRQSVSRNEMKRSFEVGEAYQWENENAPSVEGAASGEVELGENSMVFLSPGAFSIRQGNEVRSVAVHLSAEESDLHRLDEEQMNQLARMTRNNADQVSTAIAGLAADEAPDTRLKIWKYLLMLGIALMAAESLLASRTSR